MLISNKQIVLMTLLTFMVNSSFAVAIDDPCSVETGMLNIISRPTAADSACAVKFKHVEMEAGYQYQFLMNSAGRLQDFPQATIRVGLPLNNELMILPPVRVLQTAAPTTGSSATVLGLKHEIGYNAHWLGAAEIVATLPNGSAAFGSKGTGGTLNGIVSYTFNAAFNLSLMFGVSSLTEPSSQGGDRFTSINPDLVFTYSPSDYTSLYIETYGQTKRSHRDHGGYDADAGIIYLVKRNITVDIEAGQRLSGEGGFQHYLGTGFAILF